MNTIFRTTRKENISFKNTMEKNHKLIPVCESKLKFKQNHKNDKL